MTHEKNRPMILIFRCFRYLGRTSRDIGIVKKIHLNTRICRCRTVHRSCDTRRKHRIRLLVFRFFLSPVIRREWCVHIFSSLILIIYFLFLPWRKRRSISYTRTHWENCRRIYRRSCVDLHTRNNLDICWKDGKCNQSRRTWKVYDRNREIYIFFFSFLPLVVIFVFFRFRIRTCYYISNIFQKFREYRAMSEHRRLYRTGAFSF